MGKYTKRFATHSLYTTFKSSVDYLEPNISVCDDNNNIYYNPMVIETIFIAKFNVTNTTNPTSLFNNPNLLKEIEIDGIKYTGNDIFQHYNHTFETVGEHIIKYTFTEVKNNLTSDCFAGKANMVSIILPNTITSIGDSAFGSCSSLTSITIPNSVTNIGCGAFNDCSGLTSITIPSSVTSIDGSLGDFNYEDIIFEAINPNATFMRDNTNKILVSIDNSTLICGFNNTIAIPNSVTNIGNYAFYRCRSLTSVTIPNSVTSIGTQTFGGCNSLTNVTIGAGVTSIGNCAFDNCSDLRIITSLATIAPTIQSNTFHLIRTTGTLYVPSGSDYSTWMQNALYYLKYYNWTKVEQ